MDTRTDDPPYRRFLFEFFQAEAEYVNQRTDWFLIFHGILFEAFVSKQEHPRYRIILGLIGILISYLWLMAGLKQAWDLKHIVQDITDCSVMGRETAAVLKGIFGYRRKQPRPMRWFLTTPAFCIVIPGAFLIAWLLLSNTVPWAEEIAGLWRKYPTLNGWFLSLIVIAIATILCSGLYDG